MENKFDGLILHDIIKTLCKDHGLKQRDMIRDLGLNENSFWANIKVSRPNYRTLVKIAKYFDIDVDILDNAPLK